jgi:hypothetical protein
MTAGITRVSYVVMLVSPVDVYTVVKLSLFLTMAGGRFSWYSASYSDEWIQTPCDEWFSVLPLSRWMISVPVIEMAFLFYVLTQCFFLTVAGTKNLKEASGNLVKKNSDKFCRFFWVEIRLLLLFCWKILQNFLISQNWKNFLVIIMVKFGTNDLFLSPFGMK